MALGRRAGARIVLVTAANEEQASSIARALVAERLAACVNIVGPVRSIYRWREAVQDEPEYMLIIKSRASHFPRIERRVKELHSYEIPEVIALPIVAGSRLYLDWVIASTGAAGPPAH